jgi:HlyD family secretion protein
LEAELLTRDVARAQLRYAQAELARSTVRAPFDGQVLEIHARTGERVGPKGILELGRTDEMYAIAEVYETDVRRIKVGQRARVSSPALEAPIDGVVERVGMKIGKLDALSTDPAARTALTARSRESHAAPDPARLAAAGSGAIASDGGRGRRGICGGAHPHATRVP